MIAGNNSTKKTWCFVYFTQIKKGAQTHCKKNGQQPVKNHRLNGFFMQNGMYFCEEMVYNEYYCNEMPTAKKPTLTISSFF